MRQVIATGSHPGCPEPGQHHVHRVATRLDNHGVDRQILIANQQQAAISNDNLSDTPANMCKQYKTEVGY